MTEEARQARAKYQAEYRRRNPDKARKWNERYWERKAEKQQAMTMAEGGTDEIGNRQQEGA